MGTWSRIVFNPAEGSHLIWSLRFPITSPQYDIQTGFPHKGYGSFLLQSQLYASAPPENFHFSLKYFQGKGSGYIDLPKARVWSPAFNCTKGMKLFNSTLVSEEEKIVYTDADHDYEGGHDIEKCPTFDDELGCYIDSTYEVHERGECCNVGEQMSTCAVFQHNSELDTAPIHSMQRSTSNERFARLGINFIGAPARRI